MEDSPAWNVKDSEDWKVMLKQLPKPTRFIPGKVMDPLPSSPEYIATWGGVVNDLFTKTNKAIDDLGLSSCDQKCSEIVDMIFDWLVDDYTSHYYKLKESFACPPYYFRAKRYFYELYEYRCQYGSCDDQDEYLIHYSVHQKPYDIVWDSKLYEFLYI